MENFEAVLERVCYKKDLKALTSEIKEDESLLRLKRRWLMDLPLSITEQKRIEELLPPNDKILPESLLREDDVSYEEIRTCIERGFGARSCEKEPHCVQENVGVLISRDDVQDIFSLLNHMTNKGLCSFIRILTGEMIKFEKTSWSMKRRIRELLPKVIADKSDISEMKLKQLFQLLKDPKNFHGNQMVRSTTPEAYRAAALDVLDGLGDFRTSTLRAMHRKLRGVRGYIPSVHSQKSGWKPDSLISLVKKMCMEMLSNLGEVGEPAEQLAGALGVAGLTLKLIMNRPAVIDFRKFSPEIEVLQSDIAKAIHLLDDSKRVSFIELKRVQPLLDPECKLSDRSLRMAVRNLLTEYLYECSDMDKVPDYLVAILDIINGRAQLPSCKKQSSSKIHSSAQELMGEVIQKEVEYILNVSGQAKEVVLDFLPEHEFDEDFARAYLEDVKGGDTVYISDEEDEDIDAEQVGDISQHYEFHSYNSYGQSESIGETIPADQSRLSTSDEDHCSPLLSPDSRLNVPLDSLHITEMGSYETPSCKEPKVLDDECVTRKEYSSGCFDAYPDSFKVKTKQNLSSLSHSPARNSSHNDLKKEETTSYSIGTPQYVIFDFPVEESSTFSKRSRSGNQYLDVQEACDLTSMLAYCSVGHMLYKLAKIEGIELYQGDRSYLRHYPSASEESEDFCISCGSASSTKVVPAVTDEVKDALVKNIRRRMTPQPLKIRADIEMKCFQFDGVLHIKEAMRKAEAAGNKDCPVKIKLVAPPAYVLNTQTLDKEQGIAILNKAIEACTEEIERHKGKLTVKEAPRAVSEREDKLLAEHMAKLGRQNEEVSGDEDSEEEEDTGMGEIDVENSRRGITE